MRRLLICLAIWVLSSSTIKGNSAGEINQWSACGPTGLKYITDLAIDPLTPSTLYAGGSDAGLVGGRCKSMDAGDNWIPMNYDLAIFDDVRSLVIDPLTPSTLYLGTSNGVFKSTDGGSNWAFIDVSGEILAIDPLTPSTLYAGGSGLYKSTDAGENWTPIGPWIINGEIDSFDLVNVSAFAIDPLTPSTLYVSTSDEVFKSTDAGENWTPLNNVGVNAFVKAFAIDPLTPSTLYIGTESAGVFKSTDGGSSWIAMNDGLPIRETSNYYYKIIATLAIDPITPSTLYAGIYEGGVFKSTDGGNTWTDIGIGIPYKDVFLAIDPLTPSTLYWGTKGGVFKSTNAGSNWIRLNNVYVAVLAIDPLTPSTLYAGGHGVSKSTDAGENWTPINNGLTASTPTPTINALFIDPLTPSTLYLGTSDGVFKSTDAGENWTPQINGTGFIYVRELIIDPLTPSTLYTGSSPYGFFKSTDGGGNWIPINSMNGLGDQVKFLAIDPLTPSTLYAGQNGVTGGRIWKSTDGGGSWTAMSISPSIPFLNATIDMAIDPFTPSTLYLGMTWTGCYSRCEWHFGVFKSTDRGSSWTECNNGTTVVRGYQYFLAIDPLTPSTLYAGGEGYGVSKSTDAGSIWTAMNNGLGDLTVYTLSIDPLTPSTLYAGTSNGVYIFVGATSTPGGGGGNHSGSSGGGCFISTASP